MEVSAQNLTTLFTGFDMIFQKGFEAAPSYYDKICSIVPSSTSQTIYPWLGRTTGFREWVGDRIMQTLEAHTYTIVNKTFEDTISLERERIEDDQYGVYAPAVELLGWDAKTHPDQLVFGMMKAAITGAPVTIGKITDPGADLLRRQQSLLRNASGWTGGRILVRCHLLERQFDRHRPLLVPGRRGAADQALHLPEAARIRSEPDEHRD